MKKHFNKIKTKNSCIFIGTCYIVIGTFALINLKLQTIWFSNFNQSSFNGFIDIFNVLHEIWIVYMPLMILIGIFYFLFGILFQNLNKNKFLINFILSIISLIWSIAYIISSFKFIDVFINILGRNLELFKNFVYVFSIFGFIMILALFSVPQYFIGVSIKKEQNENKY